MIGDEIKVISFLNDGKTSHSGKYWDYIVVSLIVLILEFVSFMRDRHYISPDLYH